MMKKTAIVYFLLLTFFTATILASCTKGFIPEEEIVPAIPTDETITYQIHISTVISNSCISCHGGSSPQGNLLLETYSQVRNSAENGTLIQRINDATDPMPPSGLLPAQTRALIDKWAQDGFLEN